MPKITSKLENTKVFTPMDAHWARARVAKEPEIEQPDEGEAEGAVQIVNNWDIISKEDGDEMYKGRKLGFDRVIVGGVNPNTHEDYSLNRLLMYVGSLGISWECGACSNSIIGMPTKGKIEFTCPECNAVIPSISFNTEDCTGKECLINIQKKQRFSKDSKGKYTIAVKDEEGNLVYDNQITQYKPLS